MQRYTAHTNTNTVWAACGSMSKQQPKAATEKREEKHSSFTSFTFQMEFYVNATM